MTKISLYSTVTPALDDKIIGTEVAGSPSNVTKNFTVGSIVDLLQLATLDRSLDATNSADNSIAPSATNTLEKISFGVAFKKLYWAVYRNLTRAPKFLGKFFPELGQNNIGKRGKTAFARPFFKQR